MILDTLIPWAHEQGASDLHLEPGLPATIRVRGSLKSATDLLPAGEILAAAQAIIGPEWPRFEERRSHDLSKTVRGIRCRINVLHSSRGIGMAIRLLTSFSVSLDKLNLHPDLRRLLLPSQGLVIVTGSTGSGKSTTVAALIEELNATAARHIVTVESPIEFQFKPKRSLIRQREVGRDTPSFEQALLDALREDPDVLLVGEMRDPETMRLTLNAAETGHLVLVTMHSGTCAEALQRLVSAFAPEIQGVVSGQLADCLVGVVAQRLRFRPDLGIRVPECEVLMANTPVRHMIRTREFFKLPQLMEMGAEHGMWTLARYESWLAKRTGWSQPGVEREEPEPVPTYPTSPAPSAPPSASFSRPQTIPRPSPSAPSKPKSAPGRIEIEPDDGGLESVLKKLS